MGGKIQKRLTALLLLLASCIAAAGEEPADSVVRLVNAKSLELLEIDGMTCRKALEATFLHNGTYLKCDTSLWNVDTKIINCSGHVRLTQNETVLTSDKLDYFIDNNLAEFRGVLVQLQNKKNNMLRTRNLDYNTRDSLAVFRGGASMRDADGQIIECDDGSYDSSSKIFVFRNNVNMFTDSVFVKTNYLEYDGEHSRVDFRTYVDFWKEDNMLSASYGWYKSDSEVFFFRNNVHGLTAEQECWSDTLYYYKRPNDVLLLGRAHVQDTSRNMGVLANYIYYNDSLSRVTMKRDAAVAVRTKEAEKEDTLYFGADVLIYDSRRKCDIDSAEIAVAGTRLTEIKSDVIEAYRERVAKEAAAAAENARREMEKADPNLRNRKNLKKEEPAPPKESVPAPADTATAAPADSAAVAPADSIVPPAAPPDTSRVGFLQGIKNVKIFRKDMQVRCDSLRYCDLDSIMRFYIDPIIWNEGNRQYTADSLFVLVKGNSVDRANLMSNAFIATEETKELYDQIRGSDVLAFFDSEGALKRFDAIGGANAIFYLKEKEAFATVNKVDCKMMSATFRDGNLNRVHYYDNPKNDAFPIVQVPRGDRFLKGFNWRPDDRPRSKKDITELEMKPSEREYYESRPKTTFVQTDIYFPGYMESVYRGLELARARKNAPKPASEEVARDNSGEKKSPAETEPAVKDTVAALADSVQTPSQPADSLAANAEPHIPTAAELREQARKEREARREAKWAELDKRDAARAEAKALKALEKKRAKTRKAYLRQQKQKARDVAKMQKYVEKYERRKARQSQSS